MDVEFQSRTNIRRIALSPYRLQLGTSKGLWFLKIFRGSKHLVTRPLRTVDIYEITQAVLLTLPEKVIDPVTVLKSVVKLIPAVESWPIREKPKKNPRVRDPKQPL